MSAVSDESVGHVVEVAADLFDVPVVLACLPDEQRLWYESTLDDPRFEPDALAEVFGPCARKSAGVTVIEDVTTDERFRDRACVGGEHGIRFCAATSIVLPDGSRVGGFCVLDTASRSASPTMVRQVDYLGEMVAHEIALPREMAAHAKAEEELERVETEYGTVFENAHDAIFLLDVQRTTGDTPEDEIEFRFLRMNTAQESVTGIDTEQFLGLMPAEAMGEEAGRVVAANYRRCVEAKDVIEYEEEIPFPAGATHWHTKLSPVVVDGEVTEIVGIARDISEMRETRRRLQEARSELEEQRDMLRRTEHLARVGGWEYDVATDTVRGTKELYRLLAWSGSEEFDLMTSLSFCPPEVRPKVESAIEKCLEDGTAFDLEIPLVRADGERRFVHLLGRAEMEDGTVIKTAGVLQDITQRKESEERLRVLSSALDQAREAVVITEACPPDEVAPPIIYVNSAFEEMTGYQEESVLGRTPALLRGEDTSDAIFESMSDAMRRGESWTGEMTTYRKDGTPYIAHWNVAPVRTETGKIRNWVSTHRDVTERRELEEQLLSIGDEERQRVGQYLHDTLASQLAGAGMMARTLADRLDEVEGTLVEKARTVGEIIGESGEQVRQLSHSLMPAIGPANDLPTALELLAERQQKMGEIACRVATSGSVPTIEQDIALHLYRIVEEAVTNAAKHADPSEIEIELNVDEDDLHLYVRDDGTGISKDAERSEGFGLRLMQYRADLVGGTLTIEPGTGGGTDVYCRLPLNNLR